MKTKPSERAVEQWPSVELHAKSLEALANGREGDQNVQETLRFAAKHIRHLGRSESELAAMLEAIVGELACHRSEHSHAIMDARQLLTTYHQRKETTK